MKRAVIFAALAALLISTAAYAPCFYPHSRHQDYFQYLNDCVWDPVAHHWACNEGFWSLDGTCDIDCDGNVTCDGDTHVDAQTDIQTTLGYCDPICE